VIDFLTIVLVLFSVAVSQLWGGEPERRGGQIYGAIVCFSLIRLAWSGLEFAQLDLLGLLVDFCGFAAFTWITVFAWRIWPIWVASLQLLALAAHLSRTFTIPIDPLVYAVMRTAPTYLEAIVIILAVLNFRRTTRKFGSMPSWREWSGWLNRIGPTKSRANSSPISGR
jgi:hypothetical protein